ncbi:protease complex subunit PrcB family protein [Rhodocaloribacter litoris]|uniref:protease complex subunit PrcB family protein n=1 Tax=Rhodocaloribacter litoris TaxID=2558931 RepID=UPI00142332C1|nr:protease complex subunit PrcB family protein [Rhodocaloribacter litoris]QXD16647.1 protease complex subunit PrcB family protein [Rhodocaloribacter litoris]
MTKVVVVGLVLLVLAAGCRRDDAEVIVEDVELLPFENVGVGPNARLSDTTGVVLYTPEAWEAYRTRLHAAGPFKPVDFTQEMIVLVAVPVPSGGYGVEVEAIEKKEDVIEVHYVLYTPERGCITVEGPAVPYQAVKARRATGEARFIHRREPLPCTVG